jgi:hypothetical protein
MAHRALLPVALVQKVLDSLEVSYFQVAAIQIA